MCVAIILLLLALLLFIAFPIAGIIALLVPIGFVIVAMVSSKGDDPPEGYDPTYVYPEKNKVRKCPYCKENTKRDAIICPHCQKKLLS